MHGEPPASVEATFVVDRLEGDWVVVELEDGGAIDLPRWMLPPRLREGDVLRVSAGPAGAGWRVDLRVDEAGAEARRRGVAERLAALRRRDPDGDPGR